MFERKETEVNRTYKARMFEMIFSQKKELLELYNAVNGTNYDDPEQLEINTLENAIYMSMHNDVSFIIDSRQMLYEHQSTYSPNLPVRYLMYVADLYSGMLINANLYGTKRIKIPTPRFLIFYNGTDEHPDREILKLSDSYTVAEEHPSLELEAVLLNINRGHNCQLMDSCRTLKDYTEYTARVREYAEEMKIEEAVERAITECIKEGILSEFLSKNRAEARKVSIYEYDEEKHMRQEREENWRDGNEAGLIQGREEGRKEGLEEGLIEGIKVLIKTSKRLNASKEFVKSEIIENFSLSAEKAEEYITEYWDE